MALRAQPYVNKSPLGAPINAAHDLAKGLVSLWCLNERAGTTLVDMGPARTNLTAYNMSWANGDLYGSGSASVAYNTSWTQFLYPISVECWFEWVSTTGAQYSEQHLVTFGQASGHQPINLGCYYNGSTYGFFWNEYQGGTHGVYTYTIPGIPSGYHHLVGTQDGTNWLLYYDGQLVASVAYAQNSAVTGEGIQIGGFDAGGSFQRYFNGYIRKVSVYNRVLSAGEISSLYLNPWQMFTQPRRSWGNLSGNAYSQTCNETLMFTDSYSAAAVKMLTETYGLTDVRTVALAHLLTESLSLTDSRSVALVAAALTETLNLTDVRQSGWVVTLFETLTLTDTRAAGLIKLISEYYALIDTQSMPSGIHGVTIIDALADHLNNRIQ